MNIDNDKFLVVGLGKTGIQTSRFLMSMGADFKAVDAKPLESLSSEVKDMKNSGIDITTGKQVNEDFLNADVIVLSPGVSFHTPQVKNASSLGKKIISEIELAYDFITKPIIGITGTNGKTTTTTLISQILENAGKKVFTGGNIGSPLIGIAGNDQHYDLIVLELSSFQLQGTKNFKPYIGVILNITDNHLDHHKDFKEYLGSKLKLFQNHCMDNWAVFNSDDAYLEKNISPLQTNKISFGKDENTSDVFCKSDRIYFNEHSPVDVSGRKLLGTHNIDNIMAATAVSRILDLENSFIEKTIREFRPLPHRLEYVKTLNGVNIFNDSKSTSPDATLKAIESLEKPIILIAGGKDKDIDYTILNDALKNKVKRLILIGEARGKMKMQLQKSVYTSTADTLDDAVKTAFKCANPDDTLLFSPGCSSFDMFKSYEERGRIFREIVENI